MEATSYYIFNFFFPYFGLCTGFVLATRDCPRTNVTCGGGLLLVYSFLNSLLRVSQKLLNLFLYLGKLHWFQSLRQSYFYEPSVFTFRCVGDRISWKTWCWSENDRGWDVISCLLLFCVYIFYGGWIWANYHETRTTTTNCRVSFIDFYLVFPTNFRIVFLPHTNTVI